MNILYSQMIQMMFNNNSQFLIIKINKINCIVKMEKSLKKKSIFIIIIVF